MSKITTMRDSVALKEFLDSSFTRNERAAAIDRIMESCMVTRTTVYNWMYGYCRIPALYKSKIEEIFGKKIFYVAETA